MDGAGFGISTYILRKLRSVVGGLMRFFNMDGSCEVCTANVCLIGEFGDFTVKW
jgi:hypothetical protein